MHHQQHHHLHEARQVGPDGVTTIQSFVYVTAQPTFTEPVVAFSTQMPDGGFTNVGGSNVPNMISAPTAGASVQPSILVDTPVQITPTSTGGASSAPTSGGAASGVSSSPSNITPAASSSSPMGQYNMAPPASSTSAVGSPLTFGGSNENASPSSSSGSSSGGLSGGAKAGIAFGVIALFALLTLGAFFLIRRKAAKNAADAKADNEKNNSEKQNGAAPTLVPRVSVKRARADAPRLSLRPVTEMFPGEMSGPAKPQNALTPGFSTPNANRQPSPEPLKTGDINEKVANPFDDSAQLPPPNDPATPKPLNISRPSTPNGQRAEGAIAGGAAAGERAGPGPMNVHRVQLDFAPSMDDELELRQGQLVRLLHEYDDGWALCIRLDRSQQGVVPRSCVSKNPVKPRPPPGGAQGGRPRGPPPSGMRPGNRPGSPAGPGGRARSQSNGPRGSPSHQQSPFGDEHRVRSNTMGGAPPRSLSPQDNLSGSPSMSSGEASPTEGGRKPMPGMAV